MIKKLIRQLVEKEIQKRISEIEADIQLELLTQIINDIKSSEIYIEPDDPIKTYNTANDVVVLLKDLKDEIKKY